VVDARPLLRQLEDTPCLDSFLSALVSTNLQIIAENPKTLMTIECWYKAYIPRNRLKLKCYWPAMLIMDKYLTRYGTTLFLLKSFLSHQMDIITVS
jgi:hypothetical protein